MGGGPRDRDVTGGEDIGALLGEEEVDLGGPGAETGDAGDGGHGLGVIEGGQGFVGEAAFGEGCSEGADVTDLWAGESGGEE